MSKRLTTAQVGLLTYLNETPSELQACERVCHPNTAAALERRGLVTIEDGEGGFRPWFDCKITEAGRLACIENEDTPTHWMPLPDVPA